MANSSKPHILIVDDEAGIRESMEMLSMTAGYEVAVADNGLVALSQIDQRRPDLLVSDLDMPHMSGLELITHVRHRHPQISIVAMSGGWHEDVESASRLADRFYAKDQHPRVLLQAIASLIESETRCKTDHPSHPTDSDS